jgi:hypothetical protein
MLLLVLLLLSLPRAARADDLFGRAATLPELTPGSLVDAVAGEEPSAKRPRGTVIVAASLATCGPALVEWDLAAQRVVRQACLGLSHADMRIARAGGTLQVLANGRSRVLKQVDAATFRVQRSVDLGSAFRASVATDGALTVVVSDTGIDTWELLVVDGTGQVVARSASQGMTCTPVEVAVLAGRAFVVLRDNPPVNDRPRLVALRADATIVREIPLAGGSATPWLAVKGNRLLAATGGEVLELSPDLDVLARHAVSAHGHLAVSPDGHILTAEGEILTNAFTVERRIAPGEPWVHAVLWLGSTPVAVGSFAEVVRHARIHWWDPPAASP